MSIQMAQNKTVVTKSTKKGFSPQIHEENKRLQQITNEFKNHPNNPRIPANLCVTR